MPSRVDSPNLHLTIATSLTFRRLLATTCGACDRTKAVGGSFGRRAVSSLVGESAGAKGREGGTFCFGYPPRAGVVGEHCEQSVVRAWGRGSMSQLPVGASGQPID
eukprot:21653-Eustigmatos_ZCMA.PRE.1